MSKKKHSFLFYLFAGPFLILTWPLRFIWNRYFLSQSESEQLHYLHQSVRLEEKFNPHIIRLTMVLISGSIIIFIAWASVTRITEVARANGEVVPIGFVQVVQHLEGGMVRKIFTNEGALVSEGQVLFTIDDGGANQDLARSRAKHLFLEIEAERLRAFISNEKPNFDKFEIDGSMNSVSLANIKEEVWRRRELQEIHARSKKLKESLQIAKEAYNVKLLLFEKGLTSKLTLLKYQKEVNEIEAEAHKELNRIKTEIAQNSEDIIKLQNKVERLQIRSPVYGLVKGLKINTIGGVIRPGETLMEIVPLDKSLVVEARILPQDIGHVQVGQPVWVKISSYDFARYGALQGTLEFVSATTFMDQNNKPYYRGRVALLQNYVGNDPKKNIIMPGMTSEVDIITGEKSILAYLLKPIHLSLKTAFTER